MKTTVKERFFGDVFAEKAGIKPLLNQMILLDKISALKFILFGIKILAARLIHNQTIDAKGNVRIKKLIGFDIIRAVNKDLERYGGIKIQPKNEKKFEELVDTVINTSMMFLYQNTTIKKGEKEKAVDEVNETIDDMAMAFGKLAGKEAYEELKKTILHSLPEEKKSKRAKNNTEKGEDVTGIVREEFHESESTKSKSNILPEEVLLTKKEACNFLKISETTIWRLEKKGEIPKAIRKGGSVKYRKIDLLNYLNSN
jgi:predicted DNA-binding transcriptional regulator AlpA